MESIINAFGWIFLAIIVIAILAVGYFWIQGWIETKKEEQYRKWHERIYKDAGSRIQSAGYWMTGQSPVIYELMQWMGNIMINNGYVPSGDIFREKYYSLISQYATHGWSGLIEKVIDWAEQRGIFKSSSPERQLDKTFEEANELSTAIEERNLPEIKDAIGDITVTLILQAHMNGLDFKECLESAYDVISKRKGKMVDGLFVKD